MRKLFYFFSLFALSCTSCTPERYISPSSEEELSYFTFETQVDTRTSVENSFDDGDEIGIFAVRRPSVTGGVGKLLPHSNLADNKRYIYQRGKLLPKSQSDLIYYRRGERVDFYAYYPYRSHIDPTSWDIQTIEDQSTLANFRSSDFLTAKNENFLGEYNKSKPVLLNFEHLMGRLRLELTGFPLLEEIFVSSINKGMSINLQTSRMEINPILGNVKMHPSIPNKSYDILIPPHSFPASKLNISIKYKSGEYISYKHLQDFSITSGKTSYLRLSKKQDVISYSDYILAVLPPIVNFPSQGGNFPLQIKSTRKKFRNGVFVEEENVPYTFTFDGGPGPFSISNNNILTASGNQTTEKITKKLVIKHAVAESSKSVTVVVTQKGKIKIETEI